MEAKRSVIIHGESPLKGLERKSHKYLSREWINGKWRYFYKPKNQINANQAKGYSSGAASPGIVRQKTGTNALSGKSDYEILSRKLESSNRMDDYLKKKKRKERLKKSISKGRQFIETLWKQATTKVDTTGYKDLGGGVYVK